MPPQTVTDKQSLDLSPFHNGTENRWRHWIGPHYSDGVKYIAEECGAFWLIDAIASYQPRCRKDRMLREFQIWTLRRPVGNPSGAVLECFKDSGKPPAITQHIEYTDFPFDRVPDDLKFYVENNLLYLPSER